VVANGIASAPVNVIVGSEVSAPAVGRSGKSALGIALMLLGLAGAGWRSTPSRAVKRPLSERFLALRR
jgi:hypothetical protein